MAEAGSHPGKKLLKQTIELLPVAQQPCELWTVNNSGEEMEDQRLNRSPKITQLVSGLAGFRPTHLASSLFLDLHREAAVLTRGPAPGGPGSWDWALDLVGSGLWPRESADQCFLRAGEEPGTSLRCLGEKTRSEEEASSSDPRAVSAGSKWTDSQSLLHAKKISTIPLEVVDFGTSVQYTQPHPSCK